MKEANITKIFRISYGHLLPGHNGKCANLHGHNARIEVMVGGQIKDDDVGSSSGMVIDFGDVKTMVNDLLDKWDHHFLAKGDEWPVAAANLLEWWKLNMNLQQYPAELIEQMKMFALDVGFANQIVMLDCRTTAENLSRLLYLNLAIKMVDSDLYLKSVKWYETDDGCATYDEEAMLIDDFTDFANKVELEDALHKLYEDMTDGNITSHNADISAE
jgi:6-pyruvoyltetrahydropterin/6-carboxytetrahydropterin synthase